MFLWINCGSSSLKFAAIDPRTGVAALTGLAERLGSPEASLSARLGEDRHGVTLRPVAATKPPCARCWTCWTPAD